MQLLFNFGNKLIFIVIVIVWMLSMLCITAGIYPSMCPTAIS